MFLKLKIIYFQKVNIIRKQTKHWKLYICQMAKSQDRDPLEFIEYFTT